MAPQRPSIIGDVAGLNQKERKQERDGEQTECGGDSVQERGVFSQLKSQADGQREAHTKMDEDVGHVKDAGRGECGDVGRVHQQNDETDSDPFDESVLHHHREARGRSSRRAGRVV